MESKLAATLLLMLLHGSSGKLGLNAGHFRPIISSRDHRESTIPVMEEQSLASHMGVALKVYFSRLALANAGMNTGLPSGEDARTG